MTTTVPEDVRDALAKASVENAERLVRDAKALLSGGSIPTAYSLAVLATEEVGKAYLCGGAADYQTREEFRGRIRSHLRKLEAVQRARELMRTLVNQPELFGGVPPTESEVEEFWARVRRLARSEHARKMSGLYVDIGDDNTIERPADAITAQEARQAVEIAATMIQVVNPSPM